MASLATEHRITLTEIASKEGVSLSTVWRWCLKGVRHAKLESVVIGGRRFSTTEAWQRFVAATNGHRELSNGHATSEADAERFQRRQKESESFLIEQGA
jgi:hypothetical protein